MFYLARWWWGVYMQIDKIDRGKYDIQNISGTQQKNY